LGTVVLQVFWVAPTIRWVQIEGRVVILDLKSESYSVLDPVASSMWLELSASRDREGIEKTLESRFQVDREKLASDLDRFIARCIATGLLTDSPPAEPEPVTLAGTEASRWKKDRLLTVRAWWSLLCTARALSHEGFSAVYTRLARLPRASTPTAAVPDRLDRAVRAFGLAENFFFLKRAPRDCLPRSLALFTFLRSLDVPVVHHMGVQLIPFLAHAWVEFDGQVVHDDPFTKTRFVTISSM
jgi:hypothetical protein